MQRRIILGLIWLVFVGYAFFFAPDNRPDTLDLIINLSTGNIQEINPLIIALFNLMGVLPAIYACLLFFDGRGQKIPAWIFVVGSFGLGAFALLPYLILREPNYSFKGEKNIFLKSLESPLTGIVLTAITIFLLVFGLVNGNWSDFISQWHNSKFIHVMSLDFCLLSLLFPILVQDDLHRRNINNPVVFWLISFIPLLGTLVYLCLRFYLTQTDENVEIVA